MAPIHDPSLKKHRKTSLLGAIEGSMRRYIPATLAVFSAVAAAQESPRSMSAEDFVAIGNKLIGQRVLVTGCSISRASADFAYCSRPGRLDAVYLDGKTMNPRSLGDAVRYCASANLEPQCAAVVAGMASRARNRFQISGAIIIWQAPERAGKWSMVEAPLNPPIRAVLSP
jgi:hypothetical protein